MNTSFEIPAFYVRLGGMLKRLREADGRTQSDVAALLHVATNTVSRYETGRYRIPVHTVFQLQQSYGWELLTMLRDGYKLRRTPCHNCGQRNDVCAERPSGSACCRHCDHTTKPRRARMRKE